MAPEKSYFSQLLYNTFRVVARQVGLSFYRIRVFGRENWPGDGGALVCSNHQGYFDPVLVGLTCDRRLNYLAKKSLFRWPLKPMIEALDAIPVDRGGTGLAGLKETLKRLKRGEMVLIFPEGTRTETGEVARLKPGFIAVARKAKVPLVPLAADGSFQAWPKWQLLPTVGVVHVCIGEPISPERIAELDDEALLALLQRTLEALFDKAKRSRERAINTIAASTALS